MLRFSLGSFLLAALLLQAEPAKPLAEQFADLKQAHEELNKKFMTELRAAARDQEKLSKANEANRVAAKKLVDDALALIRAHLDDPAVFDGVVLLVGPMGWPLPDDILKVVLEKHARHPKLGELCYQLWYRDRETWAERILRAGAEHPQREARGLAIYSSGLYWRNRAMPFRMNAQPKPEDAKQYAAKAEQCFADVAKNYADLRSPDGRYSLGPQAAAEISRLRNYPNLKPGGASPEIVGEDIDGKPMKLSDYRGKVVLLDFWGYW